MHQVGAIIKLCDSICNRFARYRDAMEAVHNFEGVLLACLMLAFEETTAAGGGTYEKIKVSSSEGIDYCMMV